MCGSQSLHGQQLQQLCLLVSASAECVRTPWDYLILLLDILGQIMRMEWRLLMPSFVTIVLFALYFLTQTRLRFCNLWLTLPVLTELFPRSLLLRSVAISAMPQSTRLKMNIRNGCNNFERQRIVCYQISTSCSSNRPWFEICSNCFFSYGRSRILMNLWCSLLKRGTQTLSGDHIVVLVELFIFMKILQRGWLHWFLHGKIGSIPLRTLHVILYILFPTALILKFMLMSSLCNTKVLNKRRSWVLSLILTQILGIPEFYVWVSLAWFHIMCLRHTLTLIIGVLIGISLCAAHGGRIRKSLTHLSLPYVMEQPFFLRFNWLNLWARLNLSQRMRQSIWFRRMFVVAKCWLWMRCCLHQFGCKLIAVRCSFCARNSVYGNRFGQTFR